MYVARLICDMGQFTTKCSPADSFPLPGMSQEEIVSRYSISRVVINPTAGISNRLRSFVIYNPSTLLPMCVCSDDDNIAVALI